jgi:Meiotically up-regulated gene 113
MATGFIYFLQVGDTSIYKVGRTVDLQKRIESLQTGNHEKLKLNFCIYCLNVEVLEVLIHKELQTVNIRGEFFNFQCEPNGLRIMNHLRFNIILKNMFRPNFYYVIPSEPKLYEFSDIELCDLHEMEMFKDRFEYFGYGDNAD